ncbi:uncharacterized protein LOC118478600 [Aplysia californica]|uniref:Uncharacterized protein LOC118478600 n=1 Tax=Aplysia californica TaxID=6500 RepID=A0ABM1W160_APLCA|nr:uncharacterized protein LOC118478600 [Aplysia californica]
MIIERSASLSLVTHQCSLSRLDSFHSSVLIQADPDSVIIQTWDEGGLYNNWTLIFRAQAGNSLSVYDAWLNNSVQHHFPWQYDVPLGCTQFRTDPPCDQTFRSSILSNWEASKISEVKIALYKDGVEQHHIIFNASSTNFTSWFSRDRILDSSWDDPENATLFTMEGTPTLTTTNPRRFIIYGPYRGCPADYGWMLVVDSPLDNCPTILSHTPTWPRFVYSTATTRVTWSVGGADVGYAEVLAVFVKLTSR